MWCLANLPKLSKWYFFSYHWLIFWWAYAIMNCPCGILQCQHHHLWTVLPATGLITETSYLAHAHMPLVYAHELVSKYNMYFLNDSHFSLFLYVALLTTWLNLEPSYLVQSCTYTGATHTHKKLCICGQYS